MQEKILYLDITRSLAMIWIVGIWHNQVVSNENVFFRFITYGVLSVFVFMSGYLTNNRISAKDYYLHKLVKLYPLFAVSCISLYILHLISSSINYINSFPQLILSLVGISGFTGKMPMTIWFFVMIISFYASTPLLLKYRWYLAGTVEGILVLGTVFFPFDERMMIYFPFYAIGLLGKEYYIKWNDIKFSCRLITLIIGMLASYILLKQKDFAITVMMSGFFCGTAVIELSKHLSNITQKQNVFWRLLAYSSTVTYLFHRQLYSVMGGVMKQLPLPQIGIRILMFCVVICCGFVGQKMYDQILKGMHD